ncbi:hypothetical protein Ancab_004586 [Ancistrocladus abbreviatus]
MLPNQKRRLVSPLSKMQHECNQTVEELSKKLETKKSRVAKKKATKGTGNDSMLNELAFVDVQSFVIDANGKARGLALFWNDIVQLEMITNTKQIILFVKSIGSMLACVMRNARNHFLSARVRAVASSEPCIVEAQACLEAIQWALLKETDKIFLVGDCKLILDCLSIDAKPPWCARHVIHSIFELKSHLKTLVPIFVKWSSNLAAHELGQWGMRNGIVGLHDVEILPYY